MLACYKTNKDFYGIIYLYLFIYDVTLFDARVNVSFFFSLHVRLYFFYAIWLLDEEFI